MCLSYFNSLSKLKCYLLKTCSDKQVPVGAQPVLNGCHKSKQLLNVKYFLLKVAQVQTMKITGV